MLLFKHTWTYVSNQLMVVDASIGGCQNANTQNKVKNWRQFSPRKTSEKKKTVVKNVYSWRGGKHIANNHSQVAIFHSNFITVSRRKVMFREARSMCDNTVSIIYYVSSNKCYIGKYDGVNGLKESVRPSCRWTICFMIHV